MGQVLDNDELPLILQGVAIFSPLQVEAGTKDPKIFVQGPRRLLQDKVVPPHERRLRALHMLSGGSVVCRDGSRALLPKGGTRRSAREL